MIKYKCTAKNQVGKHLFLTCIGKNDTNHEPGDQIRAEKMVHTIEEMIYKVPKFGHFEYRFRIAVPQTPKIPLKKVEVEE